MLCGQGPRWRDHPLYGSGRLVAHNEPQNELIGNNAVRVEPVGEFELKGIRRPLAAYNVVAIQSSEN